MLRRLSVGGSGFDVHIILQRRNRDLAVHVADIVVGPFQADGRDRNTAHAHLQTARGIHRQAAVLKNEFAAVELDQGLWIHVRSRTRKLDPRYSVALSLNQVSGAQGAGGGRRVLVEQDTATAVQNGSPCVVSRKRQGQRCDQEQANEISPLEQVFAVGAFTPLPTVSLAGDEDGHYWLQWCPGRSWAVAAIGEKQELATMQARDIGVGVDVRSAGLMSFPERCGFAWSHSISPLA